MSLALIDVRSRDEFDRCSPFTDHRTVMDDALLSKLWLRARQKTAETQEAIAPNSALIAGRRGSRRKSD